MESFSDFSPQIIYETNRKFFLGPFLEAYRDVALSFIFDNDKADDVLHIFRDYDDLVKKPIVLNTKTIFNFSVENNKERIKEKIIETFIHRLINDEIDHKDVVNDHAVSRVINGDMKLCKEIITNESIQKEDRLWNFLLNDTDKLNEVLQIEEIPFVALTKAVEMKIEPAIETIINADRYCWNQEFKGYRSFIHYCATLEYEFFVLIESLLIDASEEYQDSSILKEAIEAEKSKNIELLISKRHKLTKDLVILVRNEHPGLKTTIDKYKVPKKGIILGILFLLLMILVLLQTSPMLKE
jgi:hypothetical protein